jgi:hypothetical protein
MTLYIIAPSPSSGGGLDGHDTNSGAVKELRSRV